jgi:hypothetical protein
MTSAYNALAQAEYARFQSSAFIIPLAYADSQSYYFCNLVRIPDSASWAFKRCPILYYR